MADSELAQQCECTQCYWTVQLSLVKIVCFISYDFYPIKNKQKEQSTFWNFFLIIVETSNYNLLATSQELLLWYLLKILEFILRNFVKKKKEKEKVKYNP